MAAAAPITRTPDILVVEDSALDREMMRRVLALHPKCRDVYFVETVSRAREAVSKYRVRMIFMDNTLPDGHGSSLALELSNTPAHRDIPVILVSDWPSPFMYAKANAPNVREIWTKDQFDLENVSRVIDGQMRPRPA